MQGEIQSCSREFATSAQSIVASENAGLIWVTKICLRVAPAFVAVYQKIINKQSRSPEVGRGSDAKIATFQGHAGLEVDWDGRRGTAHLREKQGSGVDFLETINADLHTIIIPEMSVHFIQRLALLNVWSGNFPGTQLFDLRGF